ncbi:MarR family transcriptional regulator [Cytobacillus sp. FSL W7-1323]|uniref:MarR family winged helix-turn-helix transcriptional regulator n=1 Tax=Cytobacillus TaxID=2675230 RepID=UPI0012FD8DA2|nr:MULTISPECIES: MarR family transcriptional regulator [Cytobacillus]MEA1853518.1 MarR family transcriptional regulator [Cytobacillus sp. OWB-43]MED1604949.1 MarR family transcriptional regulator [Cytobacillus kochii]
METPERLVDFWVNYSKFYNRLYNAIDNVIQQQYHLNLNEFYLLYHLSQADKFKLRLTDLQPKIGLSHSALSRLVTRMENYQNKQLVWRSICEDDKRASYITLTKEGSQLFESISNVLNQTLDASLTKPDLDHIIRMVKG